MYENENSNKCKIIQDKNGIKFFKKNKNNFSLSFTIENKNYLLSSIVDFELLNLIYKLNGDIYESCNMEKITENETNITLVMRKVFLDLLTQKYAYFNIKKENCENFTIFHSKIIKSHRPMDINKKLELVDVESIVNKFEFINNHKINVVCEFVFSDNIAVPTMVEKIFATLINKMFVRFKNFIENLN